MPSLGSLTVGVVVVARELRLLREKYPELDDDDLVQLLVARDSSLESAPIDSALTLESSISPDIDYVDFPRSIRELLRLAVAETTPTWLSAAVAGRAHVVELLTPNEHHLFEVGDLLGNPMSDSCLAWWDDLARLYRNDVDDRKMIQAREAERLTVQREQDNLKASGIDRRVEWVSIEDNSRGYDVSSFRWRGNRVVPKFIEVKSSRRRPAAFFLSRNEWRTARSVLDDYVVHLWDANDWSLLEIPADQIAPHIPNNVGSGEWTEVQIQWGAGSTLSTSDRGLVPGGE